MKKRLCFIIPMLFLILVSVAQAQGPQQVERHLIKLQYASFDPHLDGEPSITGQLRQTTSQENPYYLVQFTGPVEAIWVQQLAQLGVELLGYIPDHTHLARLTPQQVVMLNRLEMVRWVGSYRPVYKLAPALQHRANGSRSQQPDTLDLYILGFPGESITALKDVLSQHGAAIYDEADTAIGISLRITMPASALIPVIENPAVSWVEPYIQPNFTNSEGRRIMNVETVWQNQGYYGAGQIVAVSDSGLSEESNLQADFAGRLIKAFPPSAMNLANEECSAKTTWSDLNGHGTHVSGSVLGNGTSSGSDPASHNYTNSHAGAAPEAQMVFMALNTDGSSGVQCLSTNGGFIAKGYEEGARISTNSWGFSDQGGYHILSSVIDNYIWNNKDYLVLFSAGNSGPGATTIGSPGTAKNVLTVGASENNRGDLFESNADNPNEIADFSSRGPTQDGRIKPDVVSPGTWILSVRSPNAPDSSFWGNFNSDYAYVGGTSMATPLTAGASALVREWLQKGRGLQNPSAALMKALIIHGAVQLPGAAIPNMDNGWGRVDLKNTLNAQYAIFDDHNQGLTNGQSKSYTIEVAGSSKQGVLFVSPRAMVHPAADTKSMVATMPRSGAQPLALDSALLRVQSLTERYQSDSPIATPSAQGKANLTPQPGLTPPQGKGAAIPRLLLAENKDASRNYLLNLIQGGDWETQEDWSLWLGAGVPEITDGADGGVVLSGNYSVWLGGTDSDDSIWYPLSFPDTIATDQTSTLEFNLQMENLDPGFDSFCVSMTDVSGSSIGPFESGPECFDDETPSTILTYSRDFTANELASLAGQTGYLVLFTQGDAVEPHMSTFVDDIVLNVDFATPALTGTPNSGPPGTTFLLAGRNNMPYGAVSICLNSCNDQIIDATYADGRGDINVTIETMTSDSGTLTIVSQDAEGRTAQTTLTLSGSGTPTLSASPTSGEAGTKFTFTGANFLPGDSTISVVENGEALGTVGSDGNGNVEFTISTSSNTPAGTYQLQVTDSANRSASVSYEVTSVSTGQTTMSVLPASGAPGTSFVFNGSNFTPNSEVQFTLDGQSMGSATTDGSGNFEANMSTATDIAPGTYTLIATEGSKQASASFEVTGSGGGSAPSGNGIHITLTWTDPPAQAGASSTLINNLNLRVDGPGGPYHGNGGNGPDTINNVETIRLENPQAGTYTVVVEAASIDGSFGAQPYALVATTAQNFGANGASANINPGGSGGEKVYLPILLK